MIRLAIPLLCCALMACGTGSAPPAELHATHDAAVDLLERADRAGIEAAFTRLAAVTHIETVRIEELDASSTPVAFAEREFLHANGSVRLLRADSSGTLNLGSFGSRSEFRPGAGIDPLRRVLGSDPAFLDARSREDYSYEIVGDTVMYDAAATIVAVAAREGAGRDQAVRSARFVLRPEDGSLVRALVHRVSPEFLVGETSTVEVRLQPGPDGPIPETVVVRSVVNPPLARSRDMRLTRTYQPISGTDS